MSIIVHGGAGSWDKQKLKEAKPHLEESARRGFDVIKQGGSSTKAVVEALTFLENTGFFNAGKGAYPQSDGVQRLDAGIMNSNLEVGGVIGLEGNYHAISMAYRILEQKGLGRRSSILMNGNFIRLPTRPHYQQPSQIFPSSMFFPQSGYGFPFDTIGAVALDQNGVLAAGSSTGGVGEKSEPGRIGDAALMGLGYYAQGKGAATTTGQGEDLMKVDMSFLCVEYINQGDDAHKACRKALRYAETILNKNDFGGIIALDTSGQGGIAYNTGDLPYAYMKLSSH